MGAGLARLVRKPAWALEEGGIRASVSPDPLDLDGTVCERQHRLGCEGGRTLEHRHARTSGSVALSIAEGTSCVESAGEAEKAIAVKSEALEPTAYGKAGSRRERVREGVMLGHCRKTVTASTRAMDRKEDDQATGTHPLKIAEGGTRQNTERM